MKLFGYYFVVQWLWIAFVGIVAWLSPSNKVLPGGEIILFGGAALVVAIIVALVLTVVYFVWGLPG